MHPAVTAARLPAAFACRPPPRRLPSPAAGPAGNAFFEPANSCGLPEVGTARGPDEVPNSQQNFGGFCTDNMVIQIQNTCIIKNLQIQDFNFKIFTNMST